MIPEQFLRRFSYLLLSALMAALAVFPPTMAPAVAGGLWPEFDRKGSGPALPDPWDGTAIVMLRPLTDIPAAHRLLEENHARIVAALGDGLTTTIWKVRFDRGFDPYHYTLGLAEHRGVFTRVEFNIYVQPCWDAAHRTPDDSLFPSQTHLAQLHVPDAWGAAFRARGGEPDMPKIGFIDDGVDPEYWDIMGRVARGTGPAHAVGGTAHGSVMATVAAGSADNRRSGAGIAYSSTIVPLTFADARRAEMWDILKGIWYAGNHDVKVLCIAWNRRQGDPEYLLQNPLRHPIFHHLLAWYHDQRGGIAFLPVGYRGDFPGLATETLRFVPISYLVVVDGQARDGFADSRNLRSNTVRFSAPSEGIIYGGGGGAPALFTSGVSAACALAAGSAALIWSANPGLRNTDVERLMFETSEPHDPPDGVRRLPCRALNVGAAVTAATWRGFPFGPGGGPMSGSSSGGR